jgi:4-amino-4-deoxy-L-arabinose transferase-like glycosyltransferase
MPRSRIAMSKSSLAFPAALLLVVACSTAAIVSTYSRLSQTWDEGIHVSAGLEYLQAGRYTIQTENPPLARVVLALWPFMHGARLPPTDSATFIESGLAGPFYRTADYRKNLTQARVGNLLFFWACAALTWILAGGRSDPWVALLAAAAIVTLPSVVGHSGVATTDIGFVASALLALVALRRLLVKPSIASAALAGAAVGIAVVTKFSTLVFLPPAVMAIVAVREWERRREWLRSLTRFSFWRLLAIASLTTVLVIWAAYGFRIGRLSDLPQTIPPAGVMPTTGWPALIRDWRVPGHEFIHGLIYLQTHAAKGQGVRLLGHVNRRGLWQFYPVVLATKTPMPFLIFAIAGITGLVLYRKSAHWPWAAGLALGALGILLVAMTSPINLGVRHVLVIYPLVAIASAFGIVRLAEHTSRRAAVLAVGAGCIVLQLVLLVRSAPYQIMYFNTFAGSDPAFVVSDSDFDWGEHGFALEDYFREHPVPELYVRFGGTTRTCALELPPLKVLPDHPVSGWIAISDGIARANGASTVHVNPCDNIATKGPTFRVQAGSLDWLTRHEPVAIIGNIVRLYHVTEAASDGAH